MSNNRYKARLKVAKLHEKITNQRKDFLQKLSTKLIRENQSIAIEDLKLREWTCPKCGAYYKCQVKNVTF